MTTQARGLPDYVRTLGYAAQSNEPPGELIGARIAALAVEVEDLSRLQATVDHFFKAPTNSEVQYSVLGRTVFMVFQHAKKLTTSAQAIGWSPDHEMAFVVPLIGRGPKGAGERFVFWMPFITISVPEGMVTARETWGFRKQVGETDMTAFDAHALKFECRANVYDPLAWDTQGRVEPLATIEGPGPQGGLKSVWSDLETVVRAFSDMWTEGAGILKCHDIDLVWNVLDHLLHKEAEIVNLKQFRDARDPRKACFQAIVESPLKLHAIHGGGPLPEGLKAKLPNWQSHQIPEHLGLPLSGEIPVRFGAWLEADYAADLGRNVWVAGGQKKGGWLYRLLGRAV